MSGSDDQTARVKEKARALGFDVVGIARADEPLEADFARYERFVAEGMHGGMAWLAADAGVRERLDTSSILENARSVVCVGRRYQRSPEDEARDPELAQRIARYARGRDYHNGMRKKLRQLATFVRELGGNARPMCDDVPVLERAWAARAGLGFVGKNGLLIAPGQGSFLLLGEVVTTLALAPDAPIAERCGSCRRCLDACPTDAFAAPFVLDPRRCVSYLTIEHRGVVPVEQREGIGTHVFGCDDCQTVCPFNASARPRPDVATTPFAPHPRWSALDLEDLLDETRWVEVATGSPVHRATAEGLARNAAIVAGNLPRTDVTAGLLKALERACRTHPSRVVREACSWAIQRIQTVASSP